MVRHIVLFNYKPSTSEKEKLGLEAQLLALKEKINLIRSIEVGQDIGKKGNSYDVGLNSTFDTMDDVDKYIKHSDHKAVLGDIKKLCDTTVKIDYIY